MSSENLIPGVPNEIRRVITGHDAGGSSVIVADGTPPRTDPFETIPGLVSRLVWTTSSTDTLPFNGIDPTNAISNWIPKTGQTRFLVLTFPPDLIFADPNFDRAAAHAENMRINPGLAELFDESGWHTTPTIDVGIVLDGEIWLELDNGEETCLRQHDVFVQNGTRHAWRNKSDRPATFAVVLTGTGT